MHDLRLKANLLLLLVAAIWGLAFVAQRLGMDHLGPFGFNAARFLLGALSLLPLTLIFRARAGQASLRPLLRGGLAAGALLFCGASLQQAGLLYTTAGNAGFITGLYIVLVPLAARLMGQAVNRGIWAGASLALAGLYFLSINDAMIINRGDLLVLVGSAFWAGHVLIIGKLAPHLDGLRLSIIQFLICALLCLVVALIYEQDSFTLANLMATWQPIAYAGLLSVGVAYTLQVYAQKHTPASHAAIIMSLEAVFAALGGWLLLNEELTARALAGCALMLAGMLLAQLPSRKKADTQPTGHA
ncbi:DMT family transporter [Marinobacterium rhizophilum]|uniref:DMT family transporter n=1 Tax=Marinobacterium rhizophilum TaxID=420402 RepID=A0ABY5HNY5_9GAMM|nr:DMT family transporter [Marinobacterium rhizophilum]UTW13586.1 DMT family transporter [Marinobacterium rhizophilum]